ncbi:MAG TPA: transglutaminase-like domain-containing protein [Bacteroidia bacterium]|jgi:transglutaminase-like putative cysteine protease|nr:transglutaminase-like domain-containing protein [Bacteroidia bacterium]
MMPAVHTKRTLLQLLLRVLFEVAPTVAICYVTLGFLNQSFTNFNTGLTQQIIYLGAGMLVSYALYFYRARVIFTVLLLAISYWAAHKFVNHMPGEFDAFRAAVKFKLYSTLFIFGWFFGFLLSRWRWASIFISFLLSIITIYSISDTIDQKLADYMLRRLFPLFAYMGYMLMVAPVLADIPSLDLKRSSRLIMRMIVFLAIVFFVFEMQIWDKTNPIKAVDKIIEDNSGKGNNGQGDGKYDEHKGMLQKEKPDKKDDKGKGDQNGQGDDGGYKLKDTMTMSNQMSQADFIMFCAKLKNYFPDGSPKPLYFVYHYLTRFDPVKESFIRDTAMPFFDELRSDPASIPMYRSRTDSSVITNSLATQMRKTVESEVYISSNTWKHAVLGPSGTYSIQTIPVDSAYKKQFRNAYKIKSYVSDLNNAYFVYNPSVNPQLSDMQEQRFSVLRNIKDYAKVDPKLMNYYTTMPNGPLYDSIHNLALQITKDAKTPCDKILAIRDYFMQRDANGNRIYRYSLKAGAPSDPNIPNSGMLRNFLFKTHTGYCTYYAGASLLLLRSLGIPSRFTTGFATIDRADKNKGWYWFYASQAHAWTQIYFPTYGWMDFDMTIGNDDQKESPQPDGTPPLPPPEPWLVIEGKATVAPDPKSKHLEVMFNKIIFFNDEYNLNRTFTRDADASVCRVMYGDKDTTLSAIHVGDSIFVVSYDDAAKVVPQPKQGVKIEDQVEAFPKPVIADEIHIIPKDSEKQKKEDDKKKKEQEKPPLTWTQWFERAGIITGSIVIFLFLLPFMWMWILAIRLKLTSDPKKKAHRAYRFALYHYHMSGIERGPETSFEYATQKADAMLQSGFGNFMNVYFRLKYSGGDLLPGENEVIRKFAGSIRSSARKKIGFFSVFLNYLSLTRAFRYFRRPAEKEEENENKNQHDDGTIQPAHKPE